MSDHSENELFEVGDDSPERRPTKYAEDDEADNNAGGGDREEEGSVARDEEEERYIEKGPASEEDNRDGGEEEENKGEDEEVPEYKPYDYEDDDNAQEMDFKKDYGSEEGVEYDDEEEEEDGGRRKRGKKRGESKKGRKKVKKNYEEAEEDPNAEDEEGKSKKGKRKKKDEEPDEENVNDLMTDMEKAYEEDVQCMRAKRPAIAKISLLPRIEAVLKRTANQKSFLALEKNGLELLASWLTKPPGGQPPSLQVKKRIVDLIYQLPVTEEHMKNSELGKVLYNMRNNPAEDAGLRGILKDIINKWTRLVTEMVDYQTANEDIRDRRKITVSLDDYRQQNMSSLKKSIPRMVNKRSGFDFMRKPSQEGSRFQTARQDNEECDKLIKEMKRKVRKIKH